MQRHGHEALRYEWKTGTYAPENIIFCVDVDREADAEMKTAAGKSVGPVLRRMDAVKQALLLFVHSKSIMHPLHQFAFITLHKSASWYQRDFTNNLDLINAAVRNLTTEGSYSHFDLSSLLQLATYEGRVSQAQGRCLRVVLIYCRSGVVPEFPEHLMGQQNFTLDALYMHEKPSPTNCPQKVYDALVDVLEHVSQYEGYIFESSSGSARTLFKHICLLLAHPHQRLGQDEFANNVKDLATAKNSQEVVFPAPGSRPPEDSGNSGRGG